MLDKIKIGTEVKHNSFGPKSKLKSIHYKTPLYGKVVNIYSDYIVVEWDGTNFHSLRKKVRSQYDLKSIKQSISLRFDENKICKKHTLK